MNRKHPPVLSDGLKAYIAGFPIEWRDDLSQEAALACLDIAKEYQDNESYVLSVGKIAVLKAYFKIKSPVSYLPSRSHRRLFTLLKAEAGMWTIAQAAHLAKIHNTKEHIVRDVLMYINSLAQGQWGTLESAKDDLIAQDGFSEHVRAQIEIARAMRTLGEREAQLIEHRYLGDTAATQCDTAKFMGVSQTRVFQLEKRALTKMREALAE